ncbi:hypothetical protein EV361DRAFT_956809 [Lentinula raphanica]|nr:hypothetical protein EV361DRAFT_956809 [Lentinula raphanica]
MTQRTSAPTGPRKKGIPKPTTRNSMLEHVDANSESDQSDNDSSSPTGGQSRRNEKKEKKYCKDSWLWSKGTRNMDTEEIQQWEVEGDRIQWFRAEAEMYRWMEQFESKHAEFERDIEYFRTMAKAWSFLAKKNLAAGYHAYTKRHAAMFTDLANDAELRYKQVGHPGFMNLGGDEILADRVEEWRNKWLDWMDVLDIHRAYRDA